MSKSVRYRTFKNTMVFVAKDATCILVCYITTVQMICKRVLNPYCAELFVSIFRHFNAIPRLNFEIFI